MTQYIFNKLGDFPPPPNSTHSTPKPLSSTNIEVSTVILFVLFDNSRRSKAEQPSDVHSTSRRISGIRSGVTYRVIPPK